MTTMKIAFCESAMALGILLTTGADAMAQTTDTAGTVTPMPPPPPASDPPRETPASSIPITVRVRALYLAPANKSDAFSLPLAGGGSLALPSDAISVNGKVIPELDVSYRFLKYFAAEVVLTYPQKQTVYVDLPASAGGKTSIGRFYHLPPSLLAQFHPLPDFFVSPYVGAGLNVTFITSTHLADPGVTKLDLATASVGFAAQAGADIKLVGNFYASLDGKWITIGSDVKTPAGAKVTHVAVNPFLLGGGLGYRF